MPTDTPAQELAKQLPATHSFAPSKNDVLNSLAFFFGEPISPEKLRDYSEHHAATFHFPGTPTVFLHTHVGHRPIHTIVVV